jgi:hypothetical protein
MIRSSSSLYARNALGLGMILLLAACGGGGGDSTPAASTTTTALASATGGANGNAGDSTALSASPPAATGMTSAGSTTTDSTPTAVAATVTIATGVPVATSTTSTVAVGATAGPATVTSAVVTAPSAAISTVVTVPAATIAPTTASSGTDTLAFAAANGLVAQLNAYLLSWNNTLYSYDAVSTNGLAQVLVSTSADNGATWNTPAATLSGADANWYGNTIFGGAVVTAGSQVYYYFGTRAISDAGGSIGVALSSNGQSFTPSAGPVITPSAAGTWDSAGVSTPYIVTAGNNLVMYYIGTDANGLQQMGAAVSSDGLAWTKYANNPLRPATTNSTLLATDGLT